MNRLDFFDKIVEAVKECLRPEALKKHAESLAEKIKVRTRVGYGVKKSGSPQDRLKKLSPRYVTQRKALRKRGELYQDTTPAKSNLTKTGQMLNSLEGKSDQVGVMKINVSGNRTDSDLTNEQVGEFVTEAGRHFLNLSNNELRALSDMIRKDLIQRINRKLNK